MILSKIKQTVPAALNLINKLSVNSVIINGTHYMTYTNVDDFKKGINLLIDLEIFDDIIVSLKDNYLFTTYSNEVNLNQVEANAFETHKAGLLNGVHYLQLILDKIVEDIPENSILIKIAEPTDLLSLQQNIKPFQQILTNTILHPDIDGVIEYKGIEPGSTWIKIYVRSSIAISLVGSIMWASVVIYKKMQETVILDEIIKSKKIQNEQQQALLDANKVFLDMLIETEAYHIYKKYYNNESIDNEQIERIKMSIKLLSEEVSKGAEINPSLVAPENVTNLFPNMKNLPSIQSQVKQIEGSK